MPSIRFSKQRCMACCFSGGWLLTILFLRSEKYCGDKDGNKVRDGGERHRSLLWPSGRNGYTKLAMFLFQIQAVSSSYLKIRNFCL